MTLIVQPGYGGAAVSDPDAQAYLQAVEVADNQALEQSVQQAVNQFVIGCKADGIWAAIKASCILAGARTLAGALVPLVGTAPTNFNFVSGDYNRKTGLVGDGTSKRLNSNRNNNADPLDNMHLSVYISAAASGITYPICIGDTTAGQVGSSQLNPKLNATTWTIRNRSSTANSPPNTPYDALGLAGASRASSSSYRWRIGGIGDTINQVSAVNATVVNYGIFGNVTAASTNARLAFYSIGESLDLALLDARVTALITAFAAIP
jgi:hypothetical protein